MEQAPSQAAPRLDSEGYSVKKLEARVKACLAEMNSLATAGYALGFHVRYSTPRLLLRTYDARWTEVYSREGLVMQDPVVAWSFANTTPCRWSDLPCDAAGEHVLHRASRFGLCHGVASGYEAGGSRSVCGFARSDREFTISEIARLMSSFKDLHEITNLEGGAPEGMQALLVRCAGKTS
ncbi:autoinducer binding domain-containing protein [Tranquillimonas alkanivorans]|uniref:Autoinducer binding domain-containing protein n=1 Tax=Tranquillimonas alkanivorans TaxID=441119 RepID=A0A1I5S6G8_9RHOB|nr:autoinducer binding domain-containing protein [Tranquillimonas alkanivorans]SFP66315.1 Autoinducer binding domain-containing protein [Tranquillimonas alkanivorans]